MTPLQARVALGAFLLVATGVTGNALFLQGPGPVDGAARKGGAAPKADAPRQRPAAAPPEAPQRAALVAPPAAGAEADLEAPPDEADVEAVRSIQRELKRRGYGPLIADGIMRPAARAAVMAFEHEQRLPLTGEATQELLKHLVFGTSDAARTVGAGEVQSPHAEALVRDVQRLLAARGYRPGAIDGRLSAETAAAIRVFETDQGLAPKGRISAEIVTRLQDGAPGSKRPKGR